uniref:Reverse transcriptase domain-containing protein n=1 Tax=Nicotiana tabacum TaxID=4097 RepID=A0A1S4BNK6_TOBAC|nr:PREDICTED: uncharacterized protein LOC107810195 [Nicotiana tabacum]
MQVGQPKVQNAVTNQGAKHKEGKNIKQNEKGQSSGVVKTKNNIKNTQNNQPIYKVVKANNIKHVEKALEIKEPITGNTVEEAKIKNKKTKNQKRKQNRIASLLKIKNVLWTKQKTKHAPNQNIPESIEEVGTINIKSELGSLEIIEESVAPEKYGPDIRSSQHEEKDDYASATEEQEGNSDLEDDEAANSCDKEEMLNTEVIYDPVSKEIAQITLEANNNGNNFWITRVYAKSTIEKRRKLWRKIRSVHHYINGPWTILRDFNVITNAAEKKGGTPYTLNESRDFLSCMEDCGMCDLGFNGYPFTWCNGKGRRNRISERLDRVMINEGWLDLFHSNRVDHRGKTGSDHNLMIFKAGSDNVEFTRYFRFLNFWTSQSGYLSTVEEIWNIDVQGEDNRYMYELPDEEEIRNTVFSMDPNSVARPNGFNGHFYQATWNIIKKEVCQFVQAYFFGTSLTKYFTHTNLVLIPKVSSLSTLDQLRPISLCNVSNKIISKLLSTRLSQLLPKLISDNQTGFVKGRLITENILLAQEIVHDIGKNNQGGNIVIKLDMSKAYGKLSWSFLTTVLRKLYFCEVVIDMIYRLLADNWYSILINALSRALNKLPENSQFIGFSMSTSGLKINHLSYADELVLFSSRDRNSIKLIMEVLNDYQHASGQEINRDKSFFLTHNSRNRRVNRRIKRWTGFKQVEFPFTYLGCPIYIGRKKNCYFSDLASKVLNKASGWQGNLLSFGGRAIIIKHILQS